MVSPFHGNTNYSDCFTQHPALPLTINGKEVLLHGGSITKTTPAEGVDVIVGFDRGMKLTTRTLPWCPGEQFCYPITDMGVPQTLEHFHNLLTYLGDQLLADKVVYIGCIGGHGRTGLVMAAMVRRYMPEVTDAIMYVRNNYCTKAVESSEQVKWLMANFGCDAAAINKGYSSDFLPKVPTSKTQPKKSPSTGATVQSAAKAELALTGTVYRCDKKSPLCIIV